MLKRLGWTIGFKDVNSSEHLLGFPLGQQYSVGEKSTVTVYTYIYRPLSTYLHQNRGK